MPLLTVDLEVLVLTVLDGQHVQGRPVGEHQAAGFLESDTQGHAGARDAVWAPAGGALQGDTWSGSSSSNVPSISSL